MRSFTILSVLAAATAASAQTTSAPIIAENPAGAIFVAELPDKKTTTVRGSIQIGSAVDGKGVEVSLSINGLPKEGGPFIYHIHEKPVPADGNCTSTGAHLDPYKRGEVPLCDASRPETCQTGDLSGKHGNITSDPWTQKYSDLYLATLTKDPSYFGNLSIVVHTSNKTRISCANFSLKGNGTAPGTTAVPSYGPLPTGGLNATTISTRINTGGPAPTAPPAQQPSNAAHKVATGAGALVLAAAAVML
ncbi:Cu,Zn superoxide dismutase-like protein [Byssothecium circinans]|uniref:superoxide dismutase n=1 Tax=Byssothecium circinans TaxID=147558 RepID=A0A6A5TKB8_9PLEO|nr:Cu,Zn superoxide dismutase-like protein [Byssothecium circinans]